MSFNCCEPPPFDVVMLKLDSVVEISLPYYGSNIGGKRVVMRKVMGQAHSHRYWFDSYRQVKSGSVVERRTDNDGLLCKSRNNCSLSQQKAMKS